MFLVHHAPLDDSIHQQADVIQMQDNKKHLATVRSTKIVEGTTCFAEHERFNVDCQRKRCSHWIDHKPGNNCVMITAKSRQLTLQNIGEIYGLSRVRICQIVKSVLDKIKEST